MRLRLLSLALVIAFISTMVLVSPPAMAQQTGVPVTGTLEDGGTFRGVLSNAQFLADETSGTLSLISGVLTGTATLADGTRQRVTQVITIPTAVSLINRTPPVCDILFLDIAPIHLDVLGLEVNLSQIVLDINALAGPGNLLGNLLCALVGLLD